MGIFAIPVFPASAAVFTNTYGRNAIVVISGGSVTQVLVNGVSAGLGGTYQLPAGATIAVTYTGTPAWTWNTPLNMSALQPPAVDASSYNVNGLGGGGPSGAVPPTTGRACRTGRTRRWRSRASVWR